MPVHSDINNISVTTRHVNILLQTQSYRRAFSHPENVILVDNSPLLKINKNVLCYSSLSYEIKLFP